MLTDVFVNFQNMCFKIYKLGPAKIISADFKNYFNDLPFLPERMKTEKVEKLVANLHDKTEYLILIGNLKQALNHGLVLKKVHRIIKYKQKAWLRSYIDMNTDLRKKAKNDF